MTWPVELSDLAYEAAIVPERWQAFLDRAGDAAGGMGGTLFSVEGPNNEGMNQDSLISENMREAWKGIVDEGWAARNPLPARAIMSRRPGFMHDLEVFPLAEREGVAWFNEFAPKWKLGPSLGTVLQVPNGNRLLMTFERQWGSAPYDAGDVARFDMLRPSIARAVALSSQLAFQHFQSTVDLLKGLGMPGAVVNETGRLVSCNSLFEDLTPSLFEDRRSRLRLRSTAADALLQNTIAKLPAHLWPGTTASIPVPPSHDGVAAAIVHVLPIRGVAQDILFGATGLVMVDRLEARPAPSDMILRGLFDLTTAEARVAVALLENHGGRKSVADALGITPETVKSHSRSIYQKTGLTGAAELASVLGGILPVDSKVKN